MPYYQNQTKMYLKSICEEIQKAMYKPVAELNTTAWITPEPLPFEKRFSGKKKLIGIGQKWGKLWDCAWFHFSGEVPQSAAGKKVVLLIDVNGEACVVDEQGCPIRGLTNVSSTFDRSLGEPGKRVVQFVEKAKGGEKIDIWADAGNNDLFGKYKNNGTLEQAHVAICNEEMRGLYYDFEVLYQLMINLPGDKARYHSIMFALNEAAKVFHEYTEDEAKKAKEILASELNKKGGDSSLTISAVGHAHIDLAWLWPVRETIRKGARTFSTVLELMNRYPDYIFGASQPQLYQWMKDYYPDLYKKIKCRIEEGRWETQGAMWVEADTNIPGGEALIRQILYGKIFFRNEFGKDMKILWLPDVFGYTASLPQILKKSGVDYFVTIKLSGNIFNQIPHHTFYWQGIDGSRTLTHMPPEGTYNSSANPSAIMKTEKEFRDKGISDRCLLLFGIGDGGGGPGVEHLERLQRENNLDGLVPVRQEPALNFFKRIEQELYKYKTWVGELYFERHQGTYTSQARSKRFNRKMEIALRELEYASVLAFIETGFPYPKKELTEIWKEVLLYQFHDILSGTSIKRVYDESLQRYEHLLERTKQLTEKAYLALTDKINVGEEETGYMIINSLSWKRNEWVYIEGQWVHVNVPAMGYIAVNLKSGDDEHQELFAPETILENNILKIQFAEDGTIQSIFDKECNRELIAPEAVANRLSIYEDQGDAWDFPINYDEKLADCFELKTTEARVDGPRAIIKQVYTFGQSKLVQEITLTAGCRRIDFNTEVDWQESNKMLRTSFPVNVYTTEATCDIQFGNIKRPTHRNTSWDMAKFEICAHKWVDLSQGDYGVALLNDCKYGYKVLKNVIDLNLLRSPGYPDPTADRSQQEFTYSLYPHRGDHISGEVVKAAYELNIPLKILATKAHKGKLPANKSFIKVGAENVIVETVKKAEDDDNLIIRFYEAYGIGTRTKIHLNFEAKTVQLVDIVEENAKLITLDGKSVELYFRPFEIHTLKIYV